MKVLIVCLLCLLGHQVLSEDLVILSESNAIPYATATPCANGDGVIGCSDDCRGRKFCILGDVITVDCLKQTGRSHCDKNTLECVFGTVSCQNSTEFACPGEGVYPDPFNCNNFFICAPEKAVQSTCGDKVFDVNLKTCTAGIRCYTFSTVDGLCRGKIGTVVVHPLNQAVYVLCEEKNPRMGECTNGLVFNTKKLVCEYDCRAKGIFADPLNTQCYYTCSGLSSSLKAELGCCPTGLEFSEDLKKCILNKNA